MADPWAEFSPQAAPSAQAGGKDPWAEFSPSGAAPAASGAAGAIGSNALAAGKLAGRTAARVALSVPDLLVSGAQLLGKGAEKLGFAPTPEIVDTNGQPLSRALPSQAFIDSTRMGMDPDAGVAMQAADFIAPWLVPGAGAAAGRINEAAGAFNKVSEGARFLAGAGTDAALATGGGMVGQEYGGDTGAIIGSLIGGAARPTAARIGGEVMRAVHGAPNAGEIFDASRAELGPNVMPTYGQVSNNAGKGFEKAVGSVPVIKTGVDAARDASATGVQSAVNQGLSDLAGGGRYDGPVSDAALGGRIIGASQDRNVNLQNANAARQDALETAIGSNRPTEVSPLVQTMTSLSRSPETGPSISRAIDPRTADVRELIRRQNPPLTGQAAINHLMQNGGTPADWNAFLASGQIENPATTAAYGGLKDVRSDLRARTQSADPLTGHHYDTVYDAATDAMRTAANDAGVRNEFDAANQAYAHYSNVQEPWLSQQGGSAIPTGRAVPGQPRTYRYEGVPNEATIASRAKAIPEANTRYLTDIEQHLGPGVARQTLADVLSGYGQVGTSGFRPNRWSVDYGGVSDPVRSFIDQASPEAGQRFGNAATAGGAFDLRPEAGGLSKAVGWQFAIDRLARAVPGLAPAIGAAVGSSIESPALIRAVAGRANIPAMLAQLAQREGLAVGRGQ